MVIKLIGAGEAFVLFNKENITNWSSSTQWVLLSELELIPVHVPDEFGQTELPLCVRVLLDPLVGVAHHGDQQIDEDDGGDQEVEGKDQLEQDQGPLLHVLVHPKVLRSGQPEKREEKLLQGHDGGRAALWKKCRQFLINSHNFWWLGMA